MAWSSKTEPKTRTECVSSPKALVTCQTNRGRVPSHLIYLWVCFPLWSSCLTALTCVAPRSIFSANYPFLGQGFHSVPAPPILHPHAQTFKILPLVNRTHFLLKLVILFCKRGKNWVLIPMSNIYNRFITARETKLYSPNFGAGIWGSGEMNAGCMFKII